MSATRIDGKSFAARLTAALGAEIAAAAARGVVPGLAVVLVGDDPASAIYVANKERTAASLGFHSLTRRLPASASEAEVLSLVRALNADPAIDGILVQLPLPKGIEPRRIIDAIDPAKDVDGLTAVNAGRLALGEPSLVPCTPLGCALLLDDVAGAIAGAHAVVIGRSNLVGKPVAQLLLQRDCTVTVAHSRTRDLPAVVRGADIVIAAVGRPEMVRGDWIRPGAIVLDVGINRLPAAPGEKGRIVGDVAFAEAAAVARAITPVPGGIGPMTTARVPAISMFDRSSISMMPEGVQATSDARPCTSRPTFVGWKPSTSFAGSIASKTRRSASAPISFGSGDCTRMPSCTSLRFKRSTSRSRSSMLAVAGSRSRSARIPDSPADFILLPTYSSEPPSLPTSTSAMPGGRPASRVNASTSGRIEARMA